MDSQSPSMVHLKCVSESGRLRVRITSLGYSPHANCRFPRNIRVEGREYMVPTSDVKFMPTSSGKFFYSVKASRIQILGLEGSVSSSNSVSTTATTTTTTKSFKDLKVYGDDSLTECLVCADDAPGIVFVIFAPCGHNICCGTCATKLKSSRSPCPMCRAKIEHVVTRDQLE